VISNIDSYTYANKHFKEHVCRLKTLLSRAGITELVTFHNTARTISLGGGMSSVSVSLYILILLIRYRFTHATNDTPCSAGHKSHVTVDGHRKRIFAFMTISIFQGLTQALTEKVFLLFSLPPPFPFPPLPFPSPFLSSPPPPFRSRTPFKPAKRSVGVSTFLPSLPLPFYPPPLPFLLSLLSFPSPLPPLPSFPLEVGPP